MTSLNLKRARGWRHFCVNDFSKNGAKGFIRSKQLLECDAAVFLLPEMLRTVLNYERISNTSINLQSLHSYRCNGRYPILNNILIVSNVIDSKMIFLLQSSRFTSINTHSTLNLLHHSNICLTCNPRLARFVHQLLSTNRDRPGCQV